MSFYEIIKKYKDFNFNDYFKNVTIKDIKESINKENLDDTDILNLLSPKALECLEDMAKKANELSIKYFGKVVSLYTPLYLANYCENHCAYCGYNVVNKIHRKKLTLEEVRLEGEAIKKQGFKQILILTGESKIKTPISYIKDCVEVLKPMFPSIGVEVYALTEEEYKILVEAGVDSLTIYQETYNEKIYDKVHISGPKKDYKFRLDAPERGAISGMYNIGLGALLGLSDFREDAFFTALHGKYIGKKYRGVNIAYALPRIRPHEGEFDDINKVNDKNFVQILLAFKIFNPTASINISTREKPDFRENLIPLGANKISAGVSTNVGGHAIEDAGQEQFEISDTRSAKEIKNIIKDMGYQAIFKDWERI